MEIDEKFIEKLFESELFREKLNEYIAENLVITQDYNAYECEYDEMVISFAGKPIEVQSKSYGI